ncbi:DEKNAAC102857 [Brettanomyces naardenensis]|uniref:DEKNAAC102857 n=1 Tax=Brettanomyces naardenensis TaxID=13370 RepID=A0A448YLM9_BRENA|nr:DEKNAAC102857 [Brettanomyces naardenensis]
MEAIRVDARYVRQFPNKTVKVIGKLKEYSSGANTGIIEASGPIHLKFQAPQSLQEGEWYEFVATVDSSDFSLKVIEGIDMGEDLNERALNKMVELCHKFPDLFFDKSLVA